MKRINKFYLVLGILAVITAVASLFISGNEAGATTISGLGLAGFGSEGRREVFNKTKAEYPNETVVPGFIRCDIKIENGLTTYKFNFTRDTKTSKAREVKLNRTDKFKLIEIGMFLIKEDSTVEGSEILQTYANQTVFADDSTNFIGKHLEVFYNGKLSMKVDSTTFIENLGTEIFRSVGAMAQSSATTYSERGAMDGFFPMTPQLILDADRPHELNVEVPVMSGHKVGNTVTNMTNYLVVIGRGFLI